jgi:iron complex outermembrane receptor protein
MPLAPRIVLAAAVAGSVVPRALSAQARDSTRADTLVSSLQEIVVRASKPITTVGGASGLSLKIDSLRLPPSPSLEMVLREIPSLHIRRNSRGEAEISVRGSDSRQVAVLVDGVPLTLAWDARADVSVIPATAPQQIELIRGLSSMLYGPNVLGGIVDIRVGSSLLQPSQAAAALSAGVDRLGAFGSSASISLPFESSAGRWLVRAGGGFSDSPGVPLAKGVVEPIPGDRDLRVNTDARSVDGFLTGRFHSNSGAWLSFSSSTFNARRGIAAELGNTNARFWRYPRVSRSVVVASGGTGDRRALFGGRGDLEASVGLDFGTTEIDSYTDRLYTTINGFEDGRDRTLTARFLGDHSLGTRGELRTAFTLADIRHDDSLPTEAPRYRQRLTSIGVETVWRLIEDGQGIQSLRVSVGGAYDVARTPETGGRPALDPLSERGGRVGFTMAVAEGATLIHGGVSRRGRFPALRELYSGALNRFAPNPDLRPENLVALEGGFTTRIGRGELQLVGFRHQVNDAVVRVTLPAPDRRFKRVNLNRLRSTGVELLGSAPIGKVTLSADLTLQSVGLTDTAGVKREPEALPQVFGSLRSRFPLPLQLIGGTDLSVTGSQSCLDPGTGQATTLGGGALVGAELSRRWTVRPTGLLSRLETKLAVDNLGDRALYDQCGLPRPGRLIRLQVRLF